MSVETEPAPDAAAAGPLVAVASENRVTRGRRPSVRVVAIVVLVFLLAAGVGAGAYTANSSLTATYSPERAALDYFTAQERSDVNGMMSNASYVRGDGSYGQFFDRDAVAAMMKTAQNLEISDVRVVSTQYVDSSTAIVNVSMTWAAVARTARYTARKDSTRVHDLLYDSWRIEIPYATMSLSVPNQAGAVWVDGIPPPSTANTIQVIAGYHTVRMDATAFYDSETQLVNGVGDSSPSVLFVGKLSSAARSKAAAAINYSFVNCDSNAYDNCPSHTYHAPNDGNNYFFTLPGYGNVGYTYYVITIPDPTVGMDVVVSSEPRKAIATGTCNETWTMDGSRRYNFKGDWTALLTWSGSDFTVDLFYNCEKGKA